MMSQIQQSPQQLPQLLYQKGKINQEQFSAIQGKSPSEIGQYLMNNNLIPNFNDLKNQVSKLQFTNKF